jgi:hypothetical protein
MSPLATAALAFLQASTSVVAEEPEPHIPVRHDFDDPRFPSISAALGIARGDLPEAGAWLRAPSGAVDPRLVAELKAAHPGS